MFNFNKALANSESIRYHVILSRNTDSGNQRELSMVSAELAAELRRIKTLQAELYTAS